MDIRNRRQHDIADVRIELDESAATTAVAVQRPIRVRWIQTLPCILAFLSTAILVVFVVMTGLRHPTPSGSVSRLSIPIGPVKSLLSQSLAISPDGTELAYTIDGRLFRRSMDGLTPVRLGSALQAANSCFFVSSEWVGCANLGKLLKVILATGASVPLCDTPGLFGAIGFADGSIVFVPGAARGLWQVPSQGGERTLMLVPDYTKGERSYRYPATLPGNRGLLFAMLTTENSSFDDARIMAYSPGSRDKAIVTSGGTYPRYAATGQVPFARSGNLHAIPFDLKSLTPTGPAKVMLEGILMDPLNGGDSHSHFVGCTISGRALLRAIPSASDKIQCRLQRPRLNSRRIIHHRPVPVPCAFRIQLQGISGSCASQLPATPGAAI
jgi:hypothetical protein